MASKQNPIMKFRHISTKTQWGCQTMNNKNSLISIADNEYLIAIGNRMMTFNNVSHHKGSNLIDNYSIDTLKVYMMVLSLDTKFLAVLVRLKDDDKNTVNMLVYNIEQKLQDVGARTPRLIKYNNTSFIDGGGNFEFTCIAFSHDSHYIACGTNVPTHGVLIYDHLKEIIIQTVPTDSMPYQVSFNPSDSSKICTIGESSLLKFWRFTLKSVHDAPVSGLKTGHFAFKCHAWVSAADGGLVVAGTTSGMVAVIQNCQQKVPFVSAFGTSMMDVSSVDNILVRGEIVIAVSSENVISVFEMRKVLVSKGVNVLSTNLVPIAKYRFTQVENICGAQWSVRDSLNHYGIVMMTPSNLFYCDVVGDGDRGAATLLTNSEAGLEWTELTSEKVLFQFHKGSIQSLSLATQSNTFITGSFEDSTVRFWDYNTPSTFNSAEVIENFIDRKDENPFYVDMHPSGLFVACACEYEVKEYAITDSCLDLTRRISVKQPFTGPTGIPYLVTQPVSLVRYSHGGQFLAVVTGKLAQIFHLYSKDFVNSGTVGNYARIMILCDHISPITDLSFVRDDSSLVTTSSDGSVYSWIVGAHSRDQEYVCKGISATAIAISKNKEKECTIVACFESQVEEVLPLAATAVKMRRQSSINIRRISRNQTGLQNLMGFMNSENPMANFLSESSSHTPLLSSVASRASMPSIKKKSFLAVWNNKISNSPKILHTESPIRSIALGETDGSDRFDICVMGLEDGRILISILPFPFRMFDPSIVTVSPTAPPNTATVTGTLNITRSTGLGTAGSNNKKTRKPGVHAQDNVMTVLTEDVDIDDDDSTQSTHNTDATSRQSYGTALRMDGSEIGMGDRRQSSSALVRGNSTLNGIATAKSPGQRNNSSFYSPAGGGGLALTQEKTASGALEYLDESICRVMRLHVGAVNQVAISVNGMWIFTAGADGSIFMLSTSKRAHEYTELPQSIDTIENKFLIIDKTKLNVMKRRLYDIESKVDMIKKDNELIISKIVEGRDRKELELKTKMHTEISKRDEAILLGRKEYLQLKNNMKSDIDAINKSCQDTISELELAYEKKLSQESLFLDKTKQAYDEYVVHNKMNLQELQRKADLRIEQIENEKLAALKDAEKQKATVLQYFDYVKVRNNEVLESMEETQVEERHKLKEEIRTLTKQLAEANQNKLSESVQADLNMKKMEAVVDSKEVEVLRLKSSLEWANERIMQLEVSLQQATQSLGSREEMTSKWELKTGELQQKIVELEKIRKALTTQLHNLRQELGPKEEKLIKVTEKLQEMDREYELSLHALSEKDKDLSHKGNSVGLLQKQVRELRNSTNRKDAALRRAATLFDEYRFALQQAYFVSEKRTLNPTTPMSGSVAIMPDSVDPKASGKLAKGIAANTLKPDVEVVEIIAQNNGMKTAMKRLSDILTPYLVEGTIDAEMLDDIEAVKIEQDRHMQLLHTNVTGLRTNLDVINKVAATKVHNHLADNQNLLKEVNNLRSEVRAMSLDNQRLQAQLDFVQRRQADKQYLLSHPKTAAVMVQDEHQQQQQLEQNTNGNRRSSVDRNSSISVREIARDRFDSMDSFSNQINSHSQLASSMQEFDSLKRELALNPYKQESSLNSISRNQSAPVLQQESSLVRPIYENPMSDLNRRLSSLSSQMYVPNAGTTSGMTAAESKIAALIEMNVQEINTIKANEAAAATVVAQTKEKKTRDPLTGAAVRKTKTIKSGTLSQSNSVAGLAAERSLTSEGINMGSLISEGSATSMKTGSKTLGNATFQLPPVFKKQ